MNPILVLWLALLFLPSPALAQSTAFTYQGRLDHSGSPATGLYEITFTLYDSSTNGNVIGTPVTVAPVPVTNGLFTTSLDFGPSAFTGTPRWLEISVTLFGSDQPVVTLIPRQAITAAPYALHSRTATTLNSSEAAPLNIVVNGQRALRLEPNTAGAPNLLGGAALNYVAPDVIGATIVGGGVGDLNRDLEEAPNPYTNSILSDFGFIGGGLDNHILEGAFQSTIVGGFANGALADARRSFIGGGAANFISAGQSSTIAGGEGNAIENEASSSVICGGFINRIYSGSRHCFVGGGHDNAINTNAKESVIVGGARNKIGPVSMGATIGGGTDNRINSFASGSAISGGERNDIGSEASESLVAGGFNNRIGSNSQAAVIGGGTYNTISFGSWYSLIDGGDQNKIEKDTSASAIGGGQGNWVGESSSVSVIAGGSGNQIGPHVNGASIAGGIYNACRAPMATVAGGYNNYAAGYFSAITGGSHNAANGHFSLASGYGAQALHQGVFVWADAPLAEPVAFRSSNTNEFSARATGGVRFVTAIDTNGTPTAGVSLAPGSGTWSSLSDRNAKENFTRVDPRAALEKVAALPIATWNYKSQDQSIRHIGPTAQDFHAAFNVGENDRTITTVDADGVALAAIQGLNQKLEHELKTKDAQIRQLQSDRAELKHLLQTLTAK